MASHCTPFAVPLPAAYGLPSDRQAAECPVGQHTVPVQNAIDHAAANVCVPARKALLVATNRLDRLSYESRSCAVVDRPGQLLASVALVQPAILYAY